MQYILLHIQTTKFEQNKIMPTAKNITGL